MEEGIEKVKGQIREVLNDDKTVTAVAQKMLRTVLYESETMIRKAMDHYKVNDNQTVKRLKNETVKKMNA